MSLRDLGKPVIGIINEDPSFSDRDSFIFSEDIKKWMYSKGKDDESRVKQKEWNKRNKLKRDKEKSLKNHD